LKEFSRLKPNTQTDDLDDLLTTGLQKYRKAIVKLFAGKKKPETIKEIERTTQAYRTEGQRNCKCSD